MTPWETRAARRTRKRARSKRKTNKTSQRNRSRIKTGPSERDKSWPTARVALSVGRSVGALNQKRRHLIVAWLGLALVLCARVLADEPPVIPIGLDAYRQWERLPYQRIGGRAYMRSTYDRFGGNEGVDASHFLYQEADDFNVSLDVE